jgi:hypothetical protein
MFQRSHVVINGNHVRVSNPIEIFLTTTLLTRASVQVLKPWGVNKWLDLQCGEV